MNTQTKLRYFSIIAVLLLSHSVAMPVAFAELTRAELIARIPAALSPDAGISHPARSQLRAAGPVGLEALFVAHGEAIASMRSKPPAGRTQSELRLRETIEYVAQQRDVEYSHLYWFTDLALAKAEAKRLNRPILSLRMLGNLTDELSCANSRFFRTSLYSNPSVADLMRSRFVLHWSVERPVPKMTIDYGDGRILRTTITGNSIHYILDSKGRVFDGLPGLYTPSLFKKVLEQALPAVAIAENHPLDSAFLGHRATFHRAAARRLTAELESLRSSLSGSRSLRDGFVPTAAAYSKTAIELPMLQALAAPGRNGRGVNTSVGAWEEIAGKLAKNLEHERPALELMERKFALPGGVPRGSLASLIQARIQAFQQRAHVEAVRNEYSTHVTIHQFLDGATSPSLEVLNDHVYAWLFEMPRKDRWVGLLDEEIFNGIEEYGLEIVPVSQ